VTALCGGGTSAPKAGWPSLFDPTITLLAELLSARGGKWVIGALGFQLLDPISLSTFCAGDPPSLPTFTSDETNAILRLQFGADFDSGIAKLKDWLQHIIWYEVCECTSGTLTTYTAPSIPSGTPEYQPPVETSNVPCLTNAITTYSRSAGGGPSFAGFLYNDPTIIPDMVRVTSTVIASTGNFNVTVELRHQLFYSPATTDTIYTFTQGVGTQTHDYPFDPGHPSIAVYLTGGAGTGNRDVDVKAEYYCAGARPGGTTSPCCPPDVATQAALDLILKMVTLIQRQAVPFAYVYGDNHAGLTGDGEITPVSGLIGLSVAVDTLPDSYGRADGTPERLFDLGYVTLGTADGWIESRRIDFDGSLVLPPARSGVFTRIGYTLAPGVEVSIRELVREP